MARASSLPRRSTLLAFSAIMAGGLSGAETVMAQQLPSDWRQRMQQAVRDQMASRRDHRELEANGFRYIGTDGGAPYVYYVYRHADGREYHCAQKAWSTGACYPNVRRDPNVLPRHVRIPDLKRAGYRYAGVQQADGKLWHIYDKGCAAPAYLCPNEGFSGCRVTRAVGQC